MCVAEIAGRVSVWDKAGKLVAELGANGNEDQVNRPTVEPGAWQQGTVTSPHGITFDNEGNILETEWNKFGRVLRWNRK
jgi:YD repeat-containing protein